MNKGAKFDPGDFTLMIKWILRLEPLRKYVYLDTNEEFFKRTLFISKLRQVNMASQY